MMILGHDVYWVVLTCLLLIPVSELRNPNTSNVLRSGFLKELDYPTLPYVLHYHGENRASNWVCCITPPTATCLKTQKPQDCPSCTPCIPPAPAQSKLGAKQLISLTIRFKNNRESKFKWPGIPTSPPQINQPFLFEQRNYLPMNVVKSGVGYGNHRILSLEQGKHALWPSPDQTQPLHSLGRPSPIKPPGPAQPPRPI